MKYIHIEVLTPLHVGSGRILQNNTEFLKFKDVVSVIDDHKILKIIGEENIQRWIEIISNGGDLMSYLNTRSSLKHITPEQTNKRILPIVGKYLKPENGLREQIFSGNGKPLLPGSSLKGSIRTALINGLIEKSTTIPNEVLNSKKVGQNNRGNKTVSYGKFEPKLVGKDPNHDSFRLIRIGDVHFENTVCLLAQTINEKTTETEVKNQVNQLVECIPIGAEAICRASIPEDLIKEIDKRPIVKNEMKAKGYIDDFGKIFKQINAFTLRQIKSELAKYNSINLPIEASEFTEKLSELSKIISEINEKQCVIRVGFGTGYLNMTGGWPLIEWKKSLSNEAYKREIKDLGTAIRKKEGYDNFSLPKSRKIISGGEPMGYLKLTLLTEEEAITWRGLAFERENKKLKDLNFLTEQARIKEEREAERERIEKEEAKKPKMFEGVLKVLDIIDAEVISVIGNKAKLKLYAPNQSKNIRDFTYNGLIVGQALQVTVKAIAKSNGLVVAIEFYNFK